MSRDAMVVANCDTCRGKGLVRPAITSFVVSLGEGVPGDLLILDLCARHINVWLACMVLAQEVGRPFDKREGPIERPNEVKAHRRPPPSGRVPKGRCEICRSMVDPRNMVRHLVTHHGLRRPAVPKTCRDCGRSSSDEGAMLRHRAMVHKQSLAATMLAEWRKGT